MKKFGNPEHTKINRHLFALPKQLSLQFRIRYHPLSQMMVTKALTVSYPLKRYQYLHFWYRTFKIAY